jgi:hypothetical protein
LLITVTSLIPRHEHDRDKQNPRITYVVSLLCCNRIFLSSNEEELHDEADMENEDKTSWRYRVKNWSSRMFQNLNGDMSRMLLEIPFILQQYSF